MENLSNFNAMENSGGNHPFLAAFSSVLSLSSATFAMISANTVQPYLTMFGSVVALASGIFAIRYYYFATKKIK